MTQVSPPRSAGTSYVPPSPFLCTWTADEFGSSRIHLRGELDLSTLPVFQERLRDAQRYAGSVSIDLRELEFIDCAALDAILDADAVARRAGGSLSLVRGSGQVDRVLELTGLLERVEVVEPAGASPPEIS